MLVVIAIIVMLAGIILPTVFIAKRRALKVKAQTYISQLDAALQVYHDFEGNGDYPPTSLRDLGFGTNGINDGIESLMACLASKESGQAYFIPPDDAIKNLDGDKVPDSFRNDRGVGTHDAYEFVDPWGNPYVYVHWKDYDSAKTEKSKYKYRMHDGKYAYIQPGKSKVTKNFHGEMKYMIWSFGPNKKNENGEGDDVTNWAK